MLKALLFILLIPLVCALAIAVGFAPATTMDGSCLYEANRAILQGHNPYQSEHCAPFIYPPWFNLLTLPLALGSEVWGAMVWLSYSLYCIVAALQVLSTYKLRGGILISSMLVFLYTPTIGLLTVGQYTAPLILGTALLSRGIINQRRWDVGWGLFLISIKPHLGLIILLFCVTRFICKNWPKKRCVVNNNLSIQSAIKKWVKVLLTNYLFQGMLFASFLIFFCLITYTLLVPNWYPLFLAGISGFREHPTYTDFSSVISLTHLAAEYFNILDSAVFIALLIVFLLLLTPIIRRTQSVGELYGAVALSSILLSPYVRNYDASLAGPLVAMLILSKAQRWPSRLMGILSWLIALAVLFQHGRQESALLITFSLLVLLIGLLARKKGCV